MTCIGYFALLGEFCIAEMSSQNRRQIEALESILRDPSKEPVKLSYATIETITHEFSKEIGRGGFGVVYMV